MSKYIDTEHLEEVVTGLNSKGWGITRGEFKIIDRVLFEFPAADVVAVVRCKDCKYIDAIYPFCTEWDVVVDDDGFCYMGEKDE